MGDGFVQGAAGNFHGFDETAFGIQQQDEYRLLVLPAHGCYQVVIDVFRRLDRLPGQRFPESPRSQFKGGAQRGRFRHAYSLADVRYFCGLHVGQGVQRACRLDQVRGHVQHIFSLDAHPQEDGEQFRIAEAVPSLAEQLFPRQGLEGKVLEFSVGHFSNRDVRWKEWRRADGAACLPPSVSAGWNLRRRWLFQKLARRDRFPERRRPAGIPPGP